MSHGAIDGPAGSADADIVGAVVEAWGQLIAPPRSVPSRRTPTFAIDFADGRAALLRLHGPEDGPVSRVRGGLLWAEALADAAFPCPWPQRTAAGALTALAPDARVASVVQRIEGRPHRADDDPDGIHAGLATLGALLADLHLTSDAVAPEGLDRPIWSADMIWSAAFPSGERPLDRLPLDRATRHHVERLIAACPDRRDTPDFGLIQGDLGSGAICATPGGFFMVDLHVGGWGDRRFDIAGGLIHYLDRPDFPECTAAFLNGYSRAGGAVALFETTELNLFIFLQALAACTAYLAGHDTAEVQTDTFSTLARAAALPGISRAKMT